MSAFVLWAGNLLLFLVTLWNVVGLVHAVPLESFSAPLAVKCGESQRHCTGVLRVGESLGGHTGILVSKSVGGEVRLTAGGAKRVLQVEAEKVPDVTLFLSWDADSNPEILSGAGLNCFDLTQHDAHAFIMSQMFVQSECDETTVPSECPRFSVESRVYDSHDPTGQRFSASIVTRTVSATGDLVVPFSNFIRSGPRGRGDFSCTGAVTVTMRFIGFKKLQLQVGPMYTNGRGESRLLRPTAAATPLVSEDVSPDGSGTGVDASSRTPDDRLSTGAREREDVNVLQQKEQQRLLAPLQQGMNNKPVQRQGAISARYRDLDREEDVVFGAVVVGQ